MTTPAQMRYLPNIEKSPHGKNEYVRFCHGEWRVTKAIDWIAKSRDHTEEVRGKTLQMLSENLTALDEKLSDALKAG